MFVFSLPQRDQSAHAQNFGSGNLSKKRIRETQNSQPQNLFVKNNIVVRLRWMQKIAMSYILFETISKGPFTSYVQLGLTNADSTDKKAVREGPVSQRQSTL